MPPSYMRSVDARNVVMWRMTLHLRWMFNDCFNTTFCAFWSPVVHSCRRVSSALFSNCLLVHNFIPLFGIHTSSNKILCHMYTKTNLTPLAVQRERRTSAGISPKSQLHTIIWKSGHATRSVHIAIQQQNGLLAPSSHAHLMSTSFDFYIF